VARFLADTSAWHRSGQVAERWSTLIEQDELSLCAPVKLELLWSAGGPGDYAALGRDLAEFPSFTVDRRAESAAERAQAALARRSQHRGPAPIDLLVAAVAEVNDLTLLHYDRHFDAIAQVTGQPSEWIARRGTLD
jgi:predicted nucleic acid-binding protein